MFQAVDPPPPPLPPPPVGVGWVVGWWGWLGGWVVGWLGGWVVGWLGGWVVGWLGGWGVVRSWFRLGGLVWGWFRVGLRWVSGGFGVWVDLGFGLGLRRGCRVVWLRVGCCEVRGCWFTGVKGGVWDRSCRAHTVLDSIPSIASIIPKMRMMRGSGGTIPLGGGGYVAQGLVHICIYIYIYMSNTIYIYIYIILSWQWQVTLAAMQALATSRSLAEPNTKT